MKLTKTLCDALSYPHDPETEKRFVAWDEAVPGFGLRVYPSGRKVFVVAVKVRGRQRWVTLGEPGAMVYDDARDEAVALTLHNARRLAQRHRALADAGTDPSEERRRRRDQNKTLGELADEYLREAAPTLKRATRGSYKGYIRHVKRAFGKRRPETITEQDVKRWYGRMADEPTGGNRRLWMLSKLMDEAEHRGLRSGPNPCRRIKRYRETKRTRFLSPAELAKVGDALRELETDGKVSKPAAAALRLLLFTGARKSEVLSMRWQDLDLDRGVWNLPDAKAGPRPVYLNAPALAVLGSLERIEGNPHVIVGQKKGAALTTIQTPWRRVCEAAKLSDVRVHDLRHCFGAMGASGGDSLLIVGAMLGHKQASTTERYAHLADDAVRAASERVGATIEAALNGDAGGEVVELEERRRR